MPDLIAAADRIASALASVEVRAALSETDLAGPGVLIVAPTLGTMLTGRACAATWQLYVLAGDADPRATLRQLGPLLDTVTAVCIPAGPVEPVVIDTVAGAPRAGYRYPYDDRI